LKRIKLPTYIQLEEMIIGVSVKKVLWFYNPNIPYASYFEVCRAFRL